MLRARSSRRKRDQCGGACGQEAPKTENRRGQRSGFCVNLGFDVAAGRAVNRTATASTACRIATAAIPKSLGRSTAERCCCPVQQPSAFAFLWKWWPARVWFTKLAALAAGALKLAIASVCGQKASEVSHASIIASRPNRRHRLSRVFPDGLRAAVIIFEQFIIAGMGAS